MRFDQDIQVYEKKAARAQLALEDVDAKLELTGRSEERLPLEECRDNLRSWPELYNRTVRLLVLCTATSSNLSADPVLQELKE